MKHTSAAAIPNQTPTKGTKPTPDVQEQIRRRAYELYGQRGSTDGNELGDWLRAESEVTRLKAKAVTAL
jgi:hypothetical protein